MEVNTKENVEIADKNAHLGDVLSATRVQLAQERRMTKDMASTAQQIKQLQRQLALQQGVIRQLRTQLQLNLAAALHPLVVYDYEVQQRGDKFLDDLEQHQQISEEISRRCSEILAQLVEGE
jgi:hypothetical protein